MCEHADDVDEAQVHSASIETQQPGEGHTCGEPHFSRIPDRNQTDIRNELETALREATRYANEIAEAENREALRLIAASGRISVHTPTAQEMDQWRQAMAPTLERVRGWISADTLASVKNAAR